MSRIKGFIISFVFPILLGFLIANLLKYYVISSNLVSGSSMEPTLQDSDFLISEKLSYLFGSPKSGDIVIVDAPDKKLIKRVIATAGDTLTFIPADETSNTPSKVILNGKELKEDYLGEPMNVPYEMEYKIPEGEVFVMGDNRNNSKDSRYYGTFSVDDIEGRIFLEIKDTFQFLNEKGD